MDHLQAVNTLAAERYLLEEMTDAERDEFEGHFFSCSECAEDLRDGTLMVEGARSGLISRVGTAAAAPTRMPLQHLARRRWRPSVVLPWAAAASFALSTGYLSWQIPSPGPLVLTPATLRPATRGQETVVSPGAGGIVALAVDLSGAAFTGPLRYELLREGGSVVASGDATAPPAGEPLLLSIPAALLETEGRYIVRMHGSGSGGLTEEDYRFRVGEP
jgi:anti-sigma factor RsiW